jgi:hypothetical protein
MSSIQLLLQPFVQEMKSALVMQSPVEFIGIVQNAVSYMWSPIIMLSGVFYGLMILEMTINGLSVGFGALFGQVASRIVEAIIISVIGVFIGSVLTLVIADNAAEIIDEMGKVSGAVGLAASLMAFLSLIFINVKMKGAYLPAFAFALFALTLALSSAALVEMFDLPGYVHFVLDLMAVMLAYFSFIDFGQNLDEKVAKITAPICSALGGALSYLAAFLVPLTLLNNAVSGLYSP